MTQEGTCGKLDAGRVEQTEFPEGSVCGAIFLGHAFFPFSPTKSDLPNPGCFRDLGLMTFPSSRNHGLRDRRHTLKLGWATLRLPATHLISQSLGSLVYTWRVWGKQFQSHVFHTAEKLRLGGRFEVPGFYLLSGISFHFCLSSTLDQLVF